MTAKDFSRCERLVHLFDGQPRNKSTKITITIRMPAEPPPIQMTLARTGENKRCIVCSSFWMAMDSPPLAKTLHECAVFGSLGLHPGGLAPEFEPHRFQNEPCARVGPVGSLRGRLAAMILPRFRHSFINKPFIIASSFLVFIFAGSHWHFASRRASHGIPAFGFGR